MIKKKRHKNLACDCMRQVFVAPAFSALGSDILKSSHETNCIVCYKHGEVCILHILYSDIGQVAYCVTGLRRTSSLNR